MRSIKRSQFLGWVDYKDVVGKKEDGDLSPYAILVH